MLFVPGGQAELVHTHRASAKCREWVAYTGHKGPMSTQRPIVTLCSMQQVPGSSGQGGAVGSRISGN